MTNSACALIHVLDRGMSHVVSYQPDAGAERLAQGAYVLTDVREGKAPEMILSETGSEVELCVKAYDQLKSDGVNAWVVSMPSWELFEKQPQSYRDQVLPPSVTARVTVEQASTFGWHRYATDDGTMIGMNTFGASAPLKACKADSDSRPRRS